MLRLLCYFFVFLSTFYLCGCGGVDLSSDKLPPLPVPTVLATSQQVAFMNDVIEDNPKVATYYYRRALLQMESGKIEEAQKDIGQAIELDSDNGNFFFVKAQIFNQTQQIKNALIAATEAETKGLRKVDLYLLLSKLYYQNQQPIQAVKYIQKVKKIYPNNAEVFYYQGLISYDVEDTLNTVRYMEQALMVQPDYVDAYKYLYRMYSRLLKPRAALAWVQQAIEQPTLEKDAELNRWYGDALLEIGEKDAFAAAIPWYERAVTYDSTQWEAAYQVAKYYLSKKNYPLAVNYLERTLTVNPTVINANYVLGSVYEHHIKDYTKAKSNYETALRLQPTQIELSAAIKKMERRIAYEAYKLTPEYALDKLRQRENQSLNNVSDSALESYPERLPPPLAPKTTEEKSNTKEETEKQGGGNL